MPSVVLLLVLVVVATGCRRGSDASTAGRTVPPGADWFEDITARSGVAFHHVAGTNYFMPDSIGSGIALFDYDNDGRLDLFLVQDGGPDSGARHRLFHQEANGTFRDASEGSGLDVAGRGMGVFAGDVNNDGLPDLLLTEYGGVRLFQNLGGGKFRDVTREAGLDNPRWAVPASFCDLDRDGWLDLVVGNYVDYDPTQVCHDRQGRQEFCAPQAFGGTVTRIWRNRTGQPGATPRFEDVTERSGVTRAPGAALGLVCADFDGDGWPDVLCADDGRPNRLFLNRRDGTFREEAAARGLAFNAMGATAANMGVALGDVDGDGWPEVFITHLTEEFHSLFRQGPRGVFADQVARAGLQEGGFRGTGFGTVLADFDRDGHPDLALANGLVRRLTPGQTPVADGVDPWWGRYAQKAQLFANDGAGRFRDISPASSSLCGQAMVGRSLAVGDLDNDGAPDLVLAGIGGPVRILHNVAPARGHWVKLRLLDPRHGNRDAIGAEVSVRCGARQWWGMVQPASSYLASNDPAVLLGVADATRVDSVEVRWPDGPSETFKDVALDRATTLQAGAGSASGVP
jgi:hypothetical protein